MKSYQPLSPIALIQNIYGNKSLIFNLIKRDIIGRYRGSFFGVLWSFFTPLLMLAVYTFVFSVVFKARWLGGSDSKTEFALVLFSGLIIFNVFAECINKAPSLIISNSNYVKKVIFPLEILPIVTLGSALFNLGISLIVWLVFYCIFFGIPNISILLLPIILSPLLLIVLGLSWILASLGVYLRDISQIIIPITTALMFLSPIFFPLQALPPEYQLIANLNPITFAVEQSRDIMIWNKSIDWMTWGIFFATSICINWLGFVWFQKTRTGFADVL